MAVAIQTVEGEMSEEKREDEVHVIYIVHGGDPKDCRRCQMATRPPCPKCGHALSANVDSRTHMTVCEYCHEPQYLERY